MRPPKLSRNQRKHAERRARRDAERVELARVKAERETAESLRAAARDAESARQRARSDEERWAHTWHARHVRHGAYCAHPTSHQRARVGKHSHATRTGAIRRPPVRRLGGQLGLLLALVPVLAAGLPGDEP